MLLYLPPRSLSQEVTPTPTKHHSPSPPRAVVTPPTKHLAVVAPGSRPATVDAYKDTEIVTKAGVAAQVQDIWLQ